MENELEMLQLTQNDILAQAGAVQFNVYEKIKADVAALADQMKLVEVNEANIKHSKKLLAEVNKRVKLLEDKRIQVKKEVLESYNLFEAQVKEIVAIVKEADDLVRSQVKHLEELERDQKHGILEELFHKRITHYSFRDLFSFKDFLKPKHLNKTTSIEAVEKEMVEFLEKLTRDLKAIEAMPNSSSILTAYVDLKDLGAALTLVQQQEAKKKAVEAVITPTISNNIAYLVSVECKNEKELKLLEMILEANSYEFTVDKITN